MKIQVSKVFAKFINDTAKELGFEVYAKVVELSRNSYMWNVDSDLFRAMDYGDYNYGRDTAKAIMLTYPENYYAMPQYLTSYSLNKEFKRCGVSDIEGLKAMVKNMCAI